MVDITQLQESSQEENNAGDENQVDIARGMAIVNILREKWSTVIQACGKSL